MRKHLRNFRRREAERSSRRVTRARRRRVGVRRGRAGVSALKQIACTLER